MNTFHPGPESKHTGFTREKNMCGNLHFFIQPFYITFTSFSAGNSPITFLVSVFCTLSQTAQLLCGSQSCQAALAISKALVHVVIAGSTVTAMRVTRAQVACRGPRSPCSWAALSLTHSSAECTARSCHSSGTTRCGGTGCVTSPCG